MTRFLRWVRLRHTETWILRGPQWLNGPVWVRIR